MAMMFTPRGNLVMMSGYNVPAMFSGDKCDASKADCKDCLSFASCEECVKSGLCKSSGGGITPGGRVPPGKSTSWGRGRIGGAKGFQAGPGLAMFPYLIPGGNVNVEVTACASWFKEFDGANCVLDPLKVGLVGVAAVAALSLMLGIIK